jgi:hypothetical protein
VRLGQLFAHLGFLGEVHLEKGLGYIDDDELLSVMNRHRAELVDRLDGAPLRPTSSIATASPTGSSTSPSSI